MPLAIISLGILLLFFLIIVFRLNAFIAFIVVSLSVGIAQGMELNSVVISIEEGIGNTIGFLIIILALGAMLGKQVANSGAAQKITEKLIEISRYIFMCILTNNDSKCKIERIILVNTNLFAKLR